MLNKKQLRTYMCIAVLFLILEALEPVYKALECDYSAAGSHARKTQVHSTYLPTLGNIANIYSCAYMYMMFCVCMCFRLC